MVERQLNVRYDQHADVLYVSVGPFVASISNEDDDGLIWRFLPDAVNPHAVTVIDFTEHWSANERKLIEVISNRLHVNVENTYKQIANQYFQ